MADDPLLGVADALATRAPVDWQATEQSLTNEGDRAVLRELRSLAAMVALQAEDEVAGEAQDPAATTGTAAWNGLRLVESIGEGSFGRVYRAWDPQLDREVALKLLHPGVLPSVPGAVSEGRLLARVKHPNVVTVHSAAELDGEVGLTMEFVHGRTLESLLETLGPFGARETVGIGVDLCRALAAVHAAGLLHRDIKTQNVMRENGGRIVLMDFGASAWVSGSTELVGTPLYLAPEVLGGVRATPASDIYSLGVLLFHLLTGSYPVVTSSIDTLLEAHRSGRAQRLRDLRPDLPDRLVATVERAMAVQPEERFASPGALEEALAGSLASDVPIARTPRRRWHTKQILAGLAVVAALALSATQATSLLSRPSAGHAPRFASLAVLPIKNISGDPNNDYLAAGLTEALAASLSRIPSLEVKSYRPALGVTAFYKMPAAIARELKVERLVDGSIRRLPNSEQLEMTANLIDPASGAVVWSRTEQPAASSWQQAERTLFELLEFEIRGTAVTPRQVIVEATAYEDFQRGRYQLNKRTKESALAARDMFQRAIDRQPSFAAAHAGLADTYLLLGAFLWLPAEDMFPKAAASARQAITLDETLAAPHATLAYLLEVTRQWPAAEREFERAIALDPNYPTARHWYALSLVHHDHALAVSQIERAYALDPLSEIIGIDVAKVYGEVGRVDDAIGQLTRVLSIHPTFVEGQHRLAELLERARRYPEALEVLEAAVKMAPAEHRILAGLATIYGRLGRTVEARQTYERFRSQTPEQSTTIVFLMIAAAGAGDLDAALAYAERGMQARDGAVVRLLATDDYVLERFAALRGRPEFERLIKQAIALRTQ